MTKQRLSKQDTIMAIAKIWSLRSTCSSEISVGAVLATKEGHIVSTGYNGSPSGFPHCDDVGCLKDSAGHCLRAIHAEENAIIQCAIQGSSTKGLEAYCTHCPCIRCTLKLIQAGITKIYFDEKRREEVYQQVEGICNFAGVELVRI